MLPCGSRPASRLIAILQLLAIVAFARTAGAKTIVGWLGYGGDAQHTAIAKVAAQSLDRIRWQTPVDLAPQYSGNDLLIHYGSPLVTRGNTVVVPVKVGATDGFEVEGRRGSDGTLLWTQTSDYVLPPHDWVLSFGSVLGRGKLWVPGRAGTLYARTRVDRPERARVRQLVFYGAAAYAAAPAPYDAGVFINTPLVADRHGAIVFGFQVTDTTPLGLESGIARVTNGGRGGWVAAATAAGDASITKVAHGSAPALSVDQRILYIAVSDGTGWGAASGYLLALDARTLATLAAVRLKDPATGLDADVHDDGTASPTIGPDGDVYFGVVENPFFSHHGRGWLLHFDRLLNPKGAIGAFGWDDTPSIVSAAMVPSYAGVSPYLLVTKYNDYGVAGGTGVNRIAILDPNASMTDPISGIAVMRAVLTVAGPTSDPEFPGLPGAVREWCINTAAVDPITHAILANNEDGTLYRWDTTTGALAQAITLTAGLGEAYTPTIVGPDGTVYAINNATLFAVGE
ncbi:MAG: hypothetical protein HY271_01530 [Deltaproteobacteria bacterium]|nr:hypothetical protein [Deltaproteobacteria bacterium]